MSLKFGKTIRTLSLSQNYLVLIKKKVYLPFKGYLTKVKGNRRRPKQTWIRQIHNDLKPINKTVGELIDNDYERKRLKRTVTRPEEAKKKKEEEPKLLTKESN